MNIYKRLATLLTATALLCCCTAGDKCADCYVRHLTFPDGATAELKTAMAARVVPDQRQYDWQQQELTAFLHFGVNTFTDREWGTGSEDPAVFNPTDFDAAQWISLLKECGFEMVILTAKHHDGFCLWPTATTAHSVAASPWREGKGDVVAEVSRACADAGMKFGFYLSPWDLNAPSYGDSPRYNELYVAQLTELLSNYGPIAEVWFDGACGEGPDGRRQVYDWQAFHEAIRRLQPDAVAAVQGEDVRWVGNERGQGRETEWSVTPLVPPALADADTRNGQLGLTTTSKDLGSRDLVARAQELYWYPSEVDVSIRPGWFWHDYEDAQVKTLAELADIYFTSVGRNSVLLLNIPPDRRGRINEADAARLREFAQWRSRTFERNLLAGAEKQRVLECGESTEYRLAAPAEIDVIRLSENIKCGQRVESFTVEALTDSGWSLVAEGTTIGNKRLLRIEPVTASALRVTVTGSRGKALLHNAGAFRSAPVV